MPQARRGHRWPWVVGAIAGIAVALIVTSTMPTAAPVQTAFIVGIAAALMCRAVITAWLAVRRWPNDKTPTPLERQTTYDAMELAVRSIVPHLETSKLLLTESKDRYTQVDSASASTESKASTLLTIVAGASSALGIFGASKEGKAITGGPLVTIAMVFVVLALLCLLYVLRNKDIAYPTIAGWISRKTIADPGHEAALSYALAESYHESAELIRKEGRLEPTALALAYVATVSAAALVLLQTATVAVPRTTSATAASTAISSPSPGP